MGGKSSRDKGLNFERSICEMLRPYYPQAKRHLESQSQEAFGVDIDNSGQYKIQCKCTAKVPNIPQVFKEFKDQSQINVVIFKVTNKGTYAAFRVEDALKLMQYGELHANVVGEKETK